MTTQHTPTQAEALRQIVADLLAAGGTHDEMFAAIDAYHAKLDAEQAASDAAARARQSALPAPFKGSMVRYRRG